MVTFSTWLDANGFGDGRWFNYFSTNNACDYSDEMITFGLEDASNQLVPAHVVSSGGSIEYAAERPPVPRGRWRVVPIHAGFPPRAGPARVLDLGDAIDPPRLESARWEGTALLFGGRHLTASTWLEARYPDGAVHRVLPELCGDELKVELAGLVVPDEPFPVVAVNPPPRGGRSEPIWIPRPRQA